MAPDAQIRFWGRGGGRNGIWLRRRVVDLLPGLGEQEHPVRAGTRRGRAQHDRRQLEGECGEVADGNYDVILQVGSFKGERATAWGLSSETGYRLSRWPLATSIRRSSQRRVRGSLARRTRRCSHSIRCSPARASPAPSGLFGPTNMIDFTPFVSVVPRSNLVLGFEHPWYWRTSTGDGIYNPLVAAARSTDRRHGPVDWLVLRHHGGVAGDETSPAVGRHHQAQSGQRSSSAPSCGREPGLYSITAAYRF